MKKCTFQVYQEITAGYNTSNVAIIALALRVKTQMTLIELEHILCSFLVRLGVGSSRGMSNIFLGIIICLPPHHCMPYLFISRVRDVPFSFWVNLNRRGLEKFKGGYEAFFITTAIIDVTTGCGIN